MNELIIILNGIHKLPEIGAYQPKQYLCSNIACGGDVSCTKCPLVNPEYINPDIEIYVTQIHQTMEVMHHETRDSTTN
jgi:hypothetical protein